MVQILCCDGYGSMLWNLGSNPAEQYFKCWNTCVKLMYRVPFSTFTYLVKGFLAKKQNSLRNQILARYPGFFRKLLTSPSKEVRVLARMVKSDPRSATFQNLRYLIKLTRLEQAENFGSWRIRDALPIQHVPEKEAWRVGLLTSLLSLRSEKYQMV